MESKTGFKPALVIKLDEKKWEYIQSQFGSVNRIPMLAENGQVIWLEHKD